MFSLITRFIEYHPTLHSIVLFVWQRFPPWLAGYLKGVLARKWVVGAVAVMIDEDVSPPEVLLVEHSYRSKGAWGFPGGSLESTAVDPSKPSDKELSGNVIESALRREIGEELGMCIDIIGLLKIDAIPYVVEEPGPYRLDFYFRCVPDKGFVALRDDLDSKQVKPRSPEIRQIRMIPLADLVNYDLFSTDAKILNEDLPKLKPTYSNINR